MGGSPRRRVLRFNDGGWAEQVGNHVALDLVNTVSWRLDPARVVDRLPDGLAVVRWSHFVGLIDDARAADFTQEMVIDPKVGNDVAAQVRGIRERLYRLLQPVAAGGDPAVDDVEALRRWLVEVLRRAEIAAVMPLHWSVPLRTVRDLPIELGLCAWRLLEHEDPKRIRQCRDSACGWLFLDQTKNASRVWCSSADCGNRTRARRHYQRRSRTSPAHSRPSRSDGRREADDGR